MENGSGPGFLTNLEKPLSREVQRLLPGNWLECSPDPQERRGQALGGVLGGKEQTGSIAQESPRHGVIFVPADPQDPAIFYGGHNPTGVRAIAVAESLAVLDHSRTFLLRDSG
jgi:hypothetical protein